MVEDLFRPSLGKAKIPKKFVKVPIKMGLDRSGSLDPSSSLRRRLLPGVIMRGVRQEAFWVLLVRVSIFDVGWAPR